MEVLSGRWHVTRTGMYVHGARAAARNNTPGLRPVPTNGSCLPLVTHMPGRRVKFWIIKNSCSPEHRQVGGQGAGCGLCLGGAPPMHTHTLRCMCVVCGSAPALTHHMARVRAVALVCCGAVCARMPARPAAAGCAPVRSNVDRTTLHAPPSARHAFRSSLRWRRGTTLTTSS